MCPTRERVTCQSALAALAGADEKHGRKRSEKGAKTLCLLPVDVFHGLQFCMVGSKIQGLRVIGRPHEIITNVAGTIASVPTRT